MAPVAWFAWKTDYPPLDLAPYTPLVPVLQECIAQFSYGPIHTFLEALQFARPSTYSIHPFEGTLDWHEILASGQHAARPESDFDIVARQRPAFYDAMVERTSLWTAEQHPVDLLLNTTAVLLPEDRDMIALVLCDNMMLQLSKRPASLYRHRFLGAAYFLLGTGLDWPRFTQRALEEDVYVRVSKSLILCHFGPEPYRGFSIRRAQTEWPPPSFYLFLVYIQQRLLRGDLDQTVADALAPLVDALRPV
jgi:hypothetical protein